MDGLMGDGSECVGSADGKYERIEDDYGIEMVEVWCFKQKTAYEMRRSDWSSDVCSSDHKADLAMARAILLNAKMRRTGVCGATETLLVDRRSEERRAWTECVRTCSSRWSPSH